jgi:hypothetical protein
MNTHCHDPVVFSREERPRNLLRVWFVLRRFLPAIPTGGNPAGRPYPPLKRGIIGNHFSSFRIVFLTLNNFYLNIYTFTNSLLNFNNMHLLK